MMVVTEASSTSVSSEPIALTVGHVPSPDSARPSATAASVAMTVAVATADQAAVKVMLPRRKRRGFRPRRVTSPAPRDVEFLLRRAPYFSGSSTDSNAVDSTAEKYKGSIGIGVVFVATSRAHEPSLRRSVVRSDMPASRARLRAVVGGHFKQRASCPVTFVAQHRRQPAPTGVEYAAVEARFGAHVLAWSFLGAFGTPGHVPHLQLLDNHRAVALGVAIGNLMQGKVPLPADCAVNACDPGTCFLLIATPFLAPRHHALCARQSAKTLLEVGRLLDTVALGIGNEVDDASVQSDGGSRGWHGVCDLELAHDAHKPLVVVADDRTRLCRPFKLAMDHRAQPAELGKPDSCAVKAPRFGVRLAQGRNISSLALPARLPSELAKAPLPRLVELDEQLRTHVAGHVCQPRQLGSQRGEVVDLVKRGVILSLASWPGEAEQTLLVRQVPQKPQGVVPRGESFALRRRRIDAITVRFTKGPHSTTLAGGSDVKEAWSELRKLRGSSADDMSSTHFTRTWSLCPSTEDPSSPTVGSRFCIVLGDRFASNVASSSSKPTSSPTMSISLSRTRRNSLWRTWYCTSRGSRHAACEPRISLRCETASMAHTSGVPATAWSRAAARLST